MICGHCKTEGVSIEHVRSCSSPAQQSAVTAVQRVFSAPRRPKPETFGDARKRFDAKRAADRSTAAERAARLGWEGFGPDDPHAGRNQGPRIELPEAASVAAQPAPSRRKAAHQQYDAALAKVPRKVRDHDVYKGDESGPCQRCSGTGMFITYMENNVPKGPGGPCFRCGGKGHQTDCGEASHAHRALCIADGTLDPSACCDRVRNDLYDRYGVRIYL